MKVSIIIPIYKVENEIERCLASVFSQDYKSLEVILVNDATPDRSFIIAKEFIEKLNSQIPVQYIEHSCNLGVGAARNSGIRNATGEYLLFVDSDDTLFDRRVVSKLISCAEQDNYRQEIIIGSYIRVTSEEEKLYLRASILYESNDVIYDAYSKQMLDDYVWGKLIKKSFLLEHNLYFMPEIYFEDFLWFYEVYRVADRIEQICDYICYYYERESSITAQLSEKWVRDYNIAIVKLYDIYKKNPDYYPEQTIQVIEKRRRDSLRHLFAFENSENQAFIKAQLELLRSIRLPLSLHNLKYLEHNIVLRLPYPLMMYYFSKKWRNRKFGNF